MRGGEKVLAAICELYPRATLFTLVRVPGKVSDTIEQRTIRTSFVQRLPSPGRLYRYYLPLYPAAVEMFDLDGYDLVISSSHCAVKSVIRRGDARHICYCHSPMRYAWDQFDAYFGPAQVGRWPSRALRPIMAGLARWDASTAGRVDRFLANSQYVAGRIGRYYNRGSIVVYPPVDTEFYRPEPTRVQSGTGALIVSALVPYKRLDIAIEACRLARVPLRIVGQGPEEARLKQLAAGTPTEFLGWRTDSDVRDLYRSAAVVLLPGTEDFGIVPVEAQACGVPVVALAHGGACETVVDGVTGFLGTGTRSGDVRRGHPAGDRDTTQPGRYPAPRRAILDRAVQGQLHCRGRPDPGTAGGRLMMRRYNRVLVAFYILSDAALGMVAFLLAYLIRFESGLIPVVKNYPPFGQYVNMAPFIAIIVPIAFHVQGLYRLRRGRSRIDDFFAVFVGTVLAGIIGLVANLYFQAYPAPSLFPRLADAAGEAHEISRVVLALFLTINVAFTYGSRELVREVLEHRWKNGIGLKRVLIAGSGDLGRLVADKVLQHRELGFQVVGFVDDRAAGDHIGYRGLPLLGTLGETDEIIRHEKIDHVYVALPLEEHVKMLGIVEATNREGVDVHVVPDLLQFIALRARLENLDGVPIISLNDVPLRGFNSVLKRTIDVAISGSALLGLGIPFLVIALLIRRGSRGPVFYTQERMGLDGKAFHVFKFRSMYVGAEDDTGPVWARDDDPRCTPVGRWLRKLDLDELPQLWNVLRGDMSIVGPRPERPYFVEQFKHRIPQYMLRHKVKAGITGWAQVNGWRGNTSLEKRIEYDLYYIENWSVGLDLKIMWLTLVRGFHRHAF